MLGTDWLSGCDHVLMSVCRNYCLERRIVIVLLVA